MMRSVVVSMCTSAFCISARSVRYTPTPMNVQDRIVWATAFARWPFCLNCRSTGWTSGSSPIDARLCLSSLLSHM